MLQAFVRSTRICSQLFLSLIVFLVLGSSIYCGNSRGRDLGSMSSGELENFFARKSGDYLLIADHVYNGEKPYHFLAAVDTDANPLRDSANKLINICFKLNSLSLEAIRQIKVKNFENFQNNYLPKILKRYNKLSAKLIAQRDVYFISLSLIEQRLGLELPISKLKAGGGFMLLGYSLTTFLISSLYSGEYSALDYYWRGIIGGIGLCLLYNSLRDLYYFKKQACSVKRAFKDTDVIWAVTRTSSFDIRPMYRSCNLF